MLHHGKTTLIAALLIPSAALAQINVGDRLGTSEMAIQAALEAQGYVVTEIEIEDGEIEVEAMSEGQAYEFEVSPESGLVLEASLEDEDDEDTDTN